MKPARANYNGHESLREMTSGREVMLVTGAPSPPWQITVRRVLGLSVADYGIKL